MRNRDLTVGDPGRIIREYCLPLFGSVFFQQLYNLADSFVAGLFLGDDALAAVGNSYELTMIFLAFAVGCNTGCSVTVSRYFGAHDYGKVKTAISTSLVATLGVYLTLFAAGLAGAAPLLHLIRTPVAIFNDSLVYLRIYISGLGFVFFYNVATGIFAAMGDSQTPFVFLSVSSVTNIALDILFVTKFHMGVEGIAFATFLCQGAACFPAICVAFLKLKKLPTGRAPLFTTDILREFAGVMGPTVLQQGIIAAGNVIIQGVVNAYGVAIIAGYSAAVKMNNLVTACFSMIGTGVTNFVSQNLGAQKSYRGREAFKVSVRLVWCIALVMCLLYEIFPSTLVGLFLREPSGAALQTGIEFLRIASPFYFAASFKIMCDAFLLGARLMRQVVFSIFLDLGLRAGFAAMFSSIFGTACSIWLAWPLGWSIAAVITYMLYRRASIHTMSQRAPMRLTERAAIAKEAHGAANELPAKPD